jgi:hypothetical protein
MKKIFVFLNTFCFLFLFAKPVWGAFEEEMTKIPGSILAAEWAVEVLILALVGGIIYSIIRAIQLYGGLIGNSLKILGLGIFFLALESINRVLERFGLDYIRDSLGAGGKELLFALLKAAALLILAIGFQSLTTVFHKPSKEE